MHLIEACKAIKRNNPVPEKIHALTTTTFSVWT
jgi:hypothetical protein